MLLAQTLFGLNLRVEPIAQGHTENLKDELTGQDNDEPLVIRFSDSAI